MDSVGSPAVSWRPVALRHRLATALSFLEGHRVILGAGWTPWPATQRCCIRCARSPSDWNSRSPGMAGISPDPDRDM